MNDMSINSLQLSLFEKKHIPLIHPKVLSEYIRENVRRRPLKEIDSDRIIQILKKWTVQLEKVESGKSDLSETQLEQAFIEDIFCGILGYTRPPSETPYFTLFPKKGTESGREIPDFTLGFFDNGEQSTGVVSCEVKSPFAGMDCIQQSYKKKITPVEQAFNAALNNLNMKFVIVSNFNETRLYRITTKACHQSFFISQMLKEGRLTDRFHEFYYLLHRDFLLGAEPGKPGQVENLLSQTVRSQYEIQMDFYELYYKSRIILFEHLANKNKDISKTAEEKRRLLEAAQKLLDRALFICFLEDHPEGLLPRDTLEDTIERGHKSLSRSKTKVYEEIKLLFDAIDKGLDGNTHRQAIPGYNGELFKEDPFLDRLVIEDDVYRTPIGVERRNKHKSTTISIRGVFGFYRYDFDTELNATLLGHIFEQSISDIEEIEKAIRKREYVGSPFEYRKKAGIYYTRKVLTDYIVSRSLDRIVERIENELIVKYPEDRLSEDKNIQKKYFLSYIDRLLSLRIIDPAAGSGAFLISAYQYLDNKIQNIEQTINSIDPNYVSARNYGNEILENCLFGVDLNPEAVEIAKLSLWMHTAAKGQKIRDLGNKIICADSLADALNEKLGLKSVDSYFDLVVGNPPWGAEFDETRISFDSKMLRPGADIYELFIELAWLLLKPNGIMGLVVTDSLISLPTKAPVREFILDNTTIHWIHKLGIEWFEKVRKSAVIFGLEKTFPPAGHFYRSFVLLGEVRRSVIDEEKNLDVIENSISIEIEQKNDTSKGSPIYLFRGREDEALLAHIRSVSEESSHFFDRGRGVEINKDGLVIRCRSCMKWNVPGEKVKGGGYKPKKCDFCGFEIDTDTADKKKIVHEIPKTGPNMKPFVDGDILNTRYARLTYHSIDTSLKNVNYKNEELYKGPKILLRQAGVGVCATIDKTDAYCPQSVYIYKIKREVKKKGYTLEYLLAILCSRVMQYVVYKEFSNLDSAEPHVKLIHDKIERLPIPKLDFSNKGDRAIHDGIQKTVGIVLKEKKLTAEANEEIEELVARAYGLSPAQRAYVHSQFHMVHYNSAVEALFPEGIPT